jgi:ABC-type Zn uptake system ZnuABC Zn-binding protein ZnuA
VRAILALGLCLLVATTGGCSKASSSGPPTAKRIEGAPVASSVPGQSPRTEKVIEVVATSSVVADWLRVVGSTNVRTSVVVKAGLDPVSYLPTPLDVEAVKRADLVVAVGRGLEPWLDGVRQQAGGRGQVLALADGLPQRTTPSGAADPFTWLDLANAKQMVATLTSALVAADPADQQAFSSARDAYSGELDRLDQELRQVLAPVAGRGLVTAKETFGWFAARYGLEPVGAVVPSPSGTAKPPPEHLPALVKAIQAKQVKAIFAQATVPEEGVQLLAGSAGVKAVGGADALLGDTVGPAGTGTDTFVGALRHDARSVAANLA